MAKPRSTSTDNAALLLQVAALCLLLISALLLIASLISAAGISDNLIEISRTAVTFGVALGLLLRVPASLILGWIVLTISLAVSGLNIYEYYNTPEELAPSGPSVFLLFAEPAVYLPVLIVLLLPSSVRTINKPR